MKSNLQFTVQEESGLLPFLLASLKNRSRNNVKGLLRRGQITVDGVPCTDYARALRPGQRVEVRAGAPGGSAPMDMPILYEDAEIIVIDKPAGILSIATDRERENTAYRIVTDYVKAGAPSARVFIVHRLDRETSGVMLFAKNEGMKHALQENWDRLVQRRGYVAVVEGKVTPPEGTITSWLKETKTLLVYSSGREGDGKKAVTHYQTRKATQQYSMLDISLETGRKNQIRVHMRDMGHPVVGDKKYGAKASPLKRLGLHAAKLTVTHPVTGEEMAFESKVPGVFMKGF